VHGRRDGEMLLGALRGRGRNASRNNAGLLDDNCTEYPVLLVVQSFLRGWGETESIWHTQAFLRALGGMRICRGNRSI
jgi:hypothetical protein